MGVSIVIPAYNAKNYIAQTINSCLAQTYPNCEIIVVDDGSKDGTGDFLLSYYGDQIRYIYQENQGVSAARNTGVQSAKGEFIHFCDADDHLMPEKVAHSVEAFQLHPEAVLVCSQCGYMDEHGRVIPSKLRPQPLAGDVFCELLTVENFVTTSTVMVRRQMVLDVGGFNLNLSVAEDWDLWLRLAARGPFVVLNDVLGLYREVANGLHKNTLSMTLGRLRVIQLARQYAGRERCLDDAAYDRLEAGRYHTLAMVYWEQGQRSQARQAFREAIRLAPSEARVRRLYQALSYGLPARTVIQMERWVLRLLKK
jgi:glycosyltransferase involved in cell wall biosynthesis